MNVFTAREFHKVSALTVCQVQVFKIYTACVTEVEEVYAFIITAYNITAVNGTVFNRYVTCQRIARTVVRIAVIVAVLENVSHLSVSDNSRVVKVKNRV